MRPYLGVLDLVLRALKSAFSAPKIWTVEAGYLAKVVRDLVGKFCVLIKFIPSVVDQTSTNNITNQGAKIRGNYTHLSS